MATQNVCWFNKFGYCRYKDDYVGKFLPTKLIFRTRIPAKWETDESFRKDIWDKINKRISKGKISEDKDGND